LNNYSSAARDTDPFTLTEAGTYNLEIINNQATAVDYYFKLLDLSMAQDLTFNRTYADNLVRGTDTNLYRFSGQAGERLFFNSLVGRPEDKWMIYRPGSSQILVSSVLNQDLELTLPTSGEYILAVRGNSLTSATYRFSVVAPTDGE
jgi:hypothetical protein